MENKKGDIILREKKNTEKIRQERKPKKKNVFLQNFREFFPVKNNTEPYILI